MNDNLYFVRAQKNDKGHLYDIFKDETEENRLGLLKLRFGILYLFPVVDDEVVWRDELDAWVFNDINKHELDEEEQIKIFAECVSDIVEYFGSLEQ